VTLAEIAAALLSIWVVLTPTPQAGQWAWTIVSAASSREKCEEIRDGRVDRLWTICATLGDSTPPQNPESLGEGNDEENG
jgi:hypothetical protein